MISTMHYHCQTKGCKEKIGQKAHEWCMKKGIPDTCWNHTLTMRGLFGKTATSNSKVGLQAA